MNDKADQTVEDAIASGARTALATLLGMDEHTTTQCSGDELAAMLRHQLSSSLKAELATLGPFAVDMVSALAGGPENRFHTFADVFNDESPPAELLTMIKDYARLGKNQGGALPADVWNVLYFAAIVAARARCKKNITQLADSAIIEGSRWVLAMTDLDDGFRQKVAADLQRMIEQTRGAAGSKDCDCDQGNVRL